MAEAHRFALPEGHCFIIAEAGVNHNGDFDKACRLIDVAAAAGVDAVKFQTFRASDLVTPHAPKAYYQKQNGDASETQYRMLQRLELSQPDHVRLREYCEARGLLFLSTPFEENSADFLEQIGVPIFKISSGDLTNLPLLRHIARKGKPMIVSTGMATLGEVEKAVDAIIELGNPHLVLLHCVSNYPAAAADVNLRAMQTLAGAFGLPVGYSDHTLGIEIAVAAVALGARVLEKHFTLDRDLPGPDHRASLVPEELADLVRGVRNVESALGDGRKRPTGAEAEVAAVARKSLVANRDIAVGTVLTRDMIAIKRPGTGILPELTSYVEGRTARREISVGEVLKWEDLA